MVVWPPMLTILIFLCVLFASRLYHDTHNWRRMRSVVRQLKHACQRRAREAAEGAGLHPGAVAAGLGGGGLDASSLGFLPGAQGSQLLEPVRDECGTHTVFRD